MATGRQPFKSPVTMSRRLRFGAVRSGCLVEASSIVVNPVPPCAGRPRGGTLSIRQGCSPSSSRRNRGLPNHRTTACSELAFCTLVGPPSQPVPRRYRQESSCSVPEVDPISWKPSFERSSLRRGEPVQINRARGRIASINHEEDGEVPMTVIMLSETGGTSQFSPCWREYHPGSTRSSPSTAPA